jgi:adenine specific DNA methylase Mod
VNYHQLAPKSELSLTDRVSLHDNLILHGDNLKALKALLPTYAGKIKCIYIDPPYNTGNENWVYNDNVNSPMIKEWLGQVVDIEDLTRHDKWLCMMTPRLKLLRDLLCEDGVIFISCDDNEQHNLRCLLDEIFGEDNFVANIIVKANPRGRQSDNDVATIHDTLLSYAKNYLFLELNGLPLCQEDVEDFDQQDENGQYWRELGLRQRGSWNTEKLEQKLNITDLAGYINFIKETGETNTFSETINPIRSYVLDVFFRKYNEFITHNILVTSQNKNITKLSHGQQGTIYLRLKLAANLFSKTIIYDQPEDDLDNEFIMSDLVSIFRKIKKYRQVIIVSHNANLVVNADSEQIIIAQNEEGVLKYISGSLENTDINKQMCKILEGGKLAFLNREKKYGFKK